MKQQILRLRAVFVSVVIGVGFLASVLAMGDSLWHTTEQSLADSLDGYSYVVNPDRPAEAEPLQETTEALAAVPGVEDTVASVDSIGFVARGSLTDAIRMRSVDWLPQDATIVAGQFPEQDGQVLVNASVAADWGLSPGDTIRIQASPVDDAYESAEVAGLVELPVGSPLPGSDMAIYGSVETLNLIRGVSVDSYTQIFVIGTASADLFEALNASTPMSVVSLESFITAQAQSAIPGAEYVTIGMVAISIAAFFVLALVIRSVFSVRVEQDRREYALMRCLGASKRQVCGSVLVSALGVGVAGAFVGVAVAVVVFAGVLSLPGVPMSFRMAPASIGIALVAGVVICLIGAFGPARQAMRSAPLEALKVADAQERTSSRVPWVRLVLTVGACAGLLLSAHAGLLVGAIALSLMLFIMVLTLIGPITQLATRLIGAVAGTRGPISLTEAVDSIQARPHRAWSISSLVAITVAFIALVGAGSSTVLASMDRAFTDVPLPDMAIALDESAASEQEILATTQGLDSVDVSMIVNTATVDLETEYYAGTGATAVEVEPGMTSTVHQPEYLDDVTQGAVFLGEQFGFRNHDEVTATTGTGETFTLNAQVREEGTSYAFFASEDFAEMFPTVQPEIWVSFAPDANLETAVNELTTALAGEFISYRDQSTAEQVVQIGNYLNLITMFAVSLLGIGVLIALIGISNTLRVTVIERRQEIGLQRALGLLRSQVRAALTSESIVLTAVSGVVGLVLGSVVALAGAYSLTTSIEGMRFSANLPVPFFASIILLAILVAVTAALVASRRAVKVSPVAAIVS